MYALFLILNDVYRLDMIHELFYEEELGATTIDSQGMGKVLLDHNVHVPMLASMRKLIDGRKPYNKLVFSIVKEEDKLKRIVKKSKESLIVSMNRVLDVCLYCQFLNFTDPRLNVPLMKRIYLMKRDMHSSKVKIYN